MTEYNVFRKGLVIGIIILFLGASVLPSISSYTTGQTGGMKGNGDNSPPFVNITFPEEGKFVSRTINITGIAYDSDGTVESVKLKFNEDHCCQWFNATLNGINWYYEWDTTEVYDKDYYVIYVQAIDNDALKGENDTKILVDNTPPDVTILQPRYESFYILGIRRPLLSSLLLGTGLTIVIGTIYVQVVVDDPDMDRKNLPDHGIEIIKNNVTIFFNERGYIMGWDPDNWCWDYYWDDLLFDMVNITIQAWDCAENMGEDGYPVWYCGLGS